MSYTNNLIDLNIYANDFNDLDAESPDNYLNVNDFSDKNWPEKQGNLETSPILDGNLWVGFNADRGGVTKLVSSEEDLMCSSPEQEKAENNQNSQREENYTSEDWEKEFQMNFSTHSVTQDMDNLGGFASNEVMTIGEYAYDEDNESSPGSQNKSMADRWSSNDYNTVLRINNSSEKKASPNKESEKPDSQNLSNETNQTSTSLDENICSSCHTKVYITERIVILNVLYHRQCFKCAKCRRILSINNFAAYSGRLFCKPHFLEAFHQTGKYDDVDRTKENGSNANNSNFDKENKTEQTQTDELPPPQITKNIVEKFRLLESTGGTESLLPRHSSGKQNTKDYQSTNIENRSSVDMDRSDDPIDEFPTPGITKNLLSLWNNIEGKSINSSGKSASPTCGTPKRTKKDSFQMDNICTQSADIIRHDDYIEDNYPPPNTAKSLAAKFKGDPPVLQQNQSNSSVNRKSSLNRNVLIKSNVSLTSDVVSNRTPSDDWLQSRIFDPNQGSENNPIQRSDVISSQSKNELNELPEQGITQSLVGLFRSMEVKR